MSTEPRAREDMVTDEQAAALRALCLRDLATFRAMAKRAETERSQASLLFATLVRVAFVLATERKFKGRPDAEIISWIADIRSINEKSPEAVDPEIAEALIRAVLGIDESHGLDSKTQFHTALSLLIALMISPYRLDLVGEEVDKFVADARRKTDVIYRERAKRAEQGESS